MIEGTYVRGPDGKLYCPPCADYHHRNDCERLYDAPQCACPCGGPEPVPHAWIVELDGVVCEVCGAYDDSDTVPVFGCVAQ